MRLAFSAWLPFSRLEDSFRTRARTRTQCNGTRTRQTLTSVSHDLSVIVTMEITVGSSTSTASRSTSTASRSTSTASLSTSSPLRTLGELVLASKTPQEPILLSKDWFYDIACDIGQSIIATPVTVSKFLVVESHEMKDRSM